MQVAVHGSVCLVAFIKLRSAGVLHADITLVEVVPQSCYDIMQVFNLMSDIDVWQHELRLTRQGHYKPCIAMPLTAWPATHSGLVVLCSTHAA